MQTMLFVKHLFLFSLLLSIGVQVVNASDYRKLTPEETTKVSNALRDRGCKNFQNLKFDVSTNLFEAEDAICKDGKKYDIYLDRNFKIVKMKLDV